MATVVARRCGSARIGDGSFDGAPSFDVGAARVRAVRSCQGNEVPSMSGNASPSNNCLERAVTHLAGRRFTPLKSADRAERLMRVQPAAQARR